MKIWLSIFSIVICLVTPCTWGQGLDSASWAVEVSVHYRVFPNITYLTADGYESKLDVMTSRVAQQALPTLVYIHGGRWVGGTKESSVLRTLPYLEMGWAVVNIEYRLARNALAPASVEDFRCALSWVFQNAGEYGFDPDRTVLTDGLWRSTTTSSLTRSGGSSTTKGTKVAVGQESG